MYLKINIPQVQFSTSNTKNMTYKFKWLSVKTAPVQNGQSELYSVNFPSILMI